MQFFFYYLIVSGPLVDTFRPKLSDSAMIYIYFAQFNYFDQSNTLRGNDLICIG